MAEKQTKERKSSAQAIHWRMEPMSERQGQEICTWAYEPPYDEYNWPAWHEMAAHGMEFADPDIREKQYYAITDEKGQLCGFAQLFPMAGVTRLGIGMRPDLTGKGLGASFVRHIALEAARKEPVNEIDLEVRTDNPRACRTYEKAGFELTDTYRKKTPVGWLEFHCMVFHKKEINDKQ